MTRISQITLAELLKAISKWSRMEIRPSSSTVTYQFALEAHQDRARPSGEAYIEHDLAVAYTMAELGLTCTGILAGLLHDILAPHTGKERSEDKKVVSARK
jgi:(p)ppGpp synthase/HD superfamily hydrolase